MEISSKTKYIQNKIKDVEDYLFKLEEELERHLRIDVMSHIHPHGIGSLVRINPLGEVGYIYGVYSDNTLNPQFLIGRLKSNGEKSLRTYAKYWKLEDLEFVENIPKKAR